MGCGWGIFSEILLNCNMFYGPVALNKNIISLMAYGIASEQFLTILIVWLRTVLRLRISPGPGIYENFLNTISYSTQNFVHNMFLSIARELSTKMYSEKFCILGDRSYDSYVRSCYDVNQG